MMDNVEIERLVVALVGRLHGQGAPSFDSRFAAIESDLDSLASSFRVYASRNERFPCLLDADPAPLPVDPTEFYLDSVARGAVSPSSELSLGMLRSLLVSIAERSHMGYEEYGFERISDALQDRFRRFLSVDRPEPLSQLDIGGGGPMATGVRSILGVPFTVHTQASKLAVHRGPAYVLRRFVYFGAPTTPVQGQLPPGLWKFAAVSPATPFTIDPGVFDAATGSATLTAV